MKYLPSFYLRIFFFLISAFLLGSKMLLAQVTVAPSMLFIDSKSGIGNLYITNNSASPQEVSISFAFGYTDADSVGNARMNYNDTVAAKTYALNPMVRVYPKSFILNAKQEQTVRLQVRTKSSVKDAFFFSRVKVTSSQKTPDIGKKVTDAITAQINFKFDQIFPVFYRKGNVSTGLIVHDVTTALKDNKLTVVADVERTGNAAYIGSMKAELFSAANEKVALSEATASIYFRMKNKIDLDLSKVAKGKYKLLLTFETKRSDVATEDLLQAQPVTKEVTVNLE
jgi:P pilus assembly chaperone PapD